MSIKTGEISKISKYAFGKCVCVDLLVEYASKSHKLQSDLCYVLTVLSNQRSKYINRS